jgi:hypothetical protein
MGDPGAKVHSITFDGAYNNGKMYSKFEASFDIKDELNFSSENPYNNKTLYIFYDTCLIYMIKLIRNTEIWGICLIKKEINKMDHIKMLGFKKNNEGFKLQHK